MPSSPAEGITWKVRTVHNADGKPWSWKRGAGFERMGRGVMSTMAGVELGAAIVGVVLGRKPTPQEVAAAITAVLGEEESL